MLSTIPVEWIALGSAAIAIISLLIAFSSWASAARLKKRLNRVLRGGGINLEESLAKTYGEAMDAKHVAAQFDERIALLETKHAQTLTKFGLVRFNPFDDTGADLSFSLALLNDFGDGIVLTSLWARNEVRLYAKPVKERDSRYALSQEERRAIDLAMTTRLAKGPDDIRNAPSSVSST
ncbi:DUF4446 family protein [Sulfobacillus thermosulfidooxidans]|uniref:DUF4446 family protein n=1 Tax=Sulfobacillus thermosulfidooxidans TaxID=28034 RepID=UPI0009EC6451|nr:DUF4446 family protein [Sulfobacillus thermosulfidooxidans]